jgi:5'(3')-deoxyribonucleotidase
MANPMVLGIDIDNTLADTDAKIRQLIKLRFGISSRRRQISSWSYSDSLGIAQGDEKKIFWDFHKNHISSLTLLEGAKKGLEILNFSYEICLITSRPFWTIFSTKKWLTNHKIRYTSLVFTKDKSKYFSNFFALIDDNGDTALDFAQSKGVALLMDRPWNLGVSHQNIVRVKNWDDVLSFFNSLG